MNKYSESYQSLNPEQRRAVDAIDGPVLVIAGPGTGKTQLLSTRVATILNKTDVGANNILCLTFTDNAARNMRERLETMIGQAAYHVSIHTFHSFGNDIIGQFPDYFTKRQLLQQVDELGSYELLHNIFDTLSYDNPLSIKAGEEYVMLKDTLTTIGWLKQNALSPDEFLEIIRANEIFMISVAGTLAKTFADKISPSLLSEYIKLADVLHSQEESHLPGLFPNYGVIAAGELLHAIETTDPGGRYAKDITVWRNRWCEKDSSGNHVFKDSGRNITKLRAVTEVYRFLLERMSEEGLFDFDDMIMETVHALEENDDLRLTLQERYQYVLVDEFQDTNKAQLRMLNALGNNPIHEGKPNIMAVGDDDQAIYAFQGAEASNMSIFRDMYSPLIVTLTKNYRSNNTILEASRVVAEQISDRLDSLIPTINKTLEAQNQPQKVIDAVTQPVFSSELAQYDWIAEQIRTLADNGIAPQNIAVLAPRHRYLERLMPYLATQNIPVAYERRENLLDAPIIKQLLTMSRLVIAIHKNQQHVVDELLSEILGYEFWQHDTAELIHLGIAAYNTHQHWLEVIPKQKNTKFTNVCNWFMELSKLYPLEPLEYMLDELIGKPLEKSGFTSPLRDYYFNIEKYENDTDSYLTLLGQLSTLRQRLRSWKPYKTIHLDDFVKFAELHEKAHLKIVDTNPHTQTTNAVQVMTVYKSKGLEFDHVFMINVQDEIWGPTSRSANHRIRLPINVPIKATSDSDNDKLRLLFVALTRARHAVHISSYTHSLENKLTPGLSFIGGNSEVNEVSPHFKATAIDRPATTKAVEILGTDWAYRFRQIIADRPSLFEPILGTYKLSVTHLNNFIDVTKNGPEYFLIHNLLRFPEAPTPAAAYGDVIHKTLQWAYSELRLSSKLPKQAAVDNYFSDLLRRKHLRASDFTRLELRGKSALERYFKERSKNMNTKDLIERGFNNEGVVIEEARLSGKIDKLRFLDTGNVEVVDFKTGKPTTSWQGKDDYEKIKLHKYRQQLMFYKLLVEHSASYAKKLTVTSGSLEFIEPDEHNKLIDNLSMNFDEQDLTQFVKLVTSVWVHIQSLNFPDVAVYPKNYKGLLNFEQDLISSSV